MAKVTGPIGPRRNIALTLKQLREKNEKLLIIGGSLGAQQLDAKGINALATMPSLDQLRGKILGMLQTPATRIAGVLQAPGAQLARVFAAYGKTG